MSPHCVFAPSPHALALSACLLLLPDGAHAQTITGVVVEDSTRAPISGAFVELVSRDARVAASAETDDAGSFVLRPRRSGSYFLRLTHTAFAGLDSLTVTLEPGAAIEVRVRMGRTAVPLEPLLVTARSDARLAGFHERAERNAFGSFVVRADIEARPAINRASDILRDVRSVEIFKRPGPSGVTFVTMYGTTGRCMPVVLLDGLEVQQPIDEFMSPEMIEGVEVYPRSTGAPAEWSVDNSCGVVAFWTRDFEGGQAWSWKRLAAGAGALGVLSVIVLLVR